MKVSGQKKQTRKRALALDAKENLKKKVRRRYSSSSSTSTSSSSSSLSSSSSSSSSLSSSSSNSSRSGGNNLNKRKIKRKRKPSSTDTSSSSSCSSNKKQSRLKKIKEKKFKQKLLECRKSKSDGAKSSKACKEQTDEDASTDVPLHLMDKSKVMAPMTKEQWEKQQSVVRKVYDESSGRHRLIKGDGEVIEEIVSKEQHKRINQQATKGDGDYFQRKTFEHH